MTNQNPPPDPTAQETSHAVTERWRCYKMQEKYGWRLKRIEPKQGSIFKYDCVFEGDAQFPDYMED
ncbi:hypothetical protein QUA56_32800 [Microcoleus sp. N3A4]|uniref:hypothetical protein n=1 Tax=Microcoleus sp. N3A4 TaxID=3055379 RepID=UPI002FD39CCF